MVNIAMIKTIVIVYSFFTNLILAEDLYEYTISILWKQDIFKLSDISSFCTYALAFTKKYGMQKTKCKLADYN